MPDNSDWGEEDGHARLRWRIEAKNKWKEGGKEGTERRRCENEATEVRTPNACEMKRIKGFHTSRKRRKVCGGRRMND